MPSARSREKSSREKSQTPNAKYKRNIDKTSYTYRRNAIKSKYANRLTRWSKLEPRNPLEVMDKKIELNWECREELKALLEEFPEEMARIANAAKTVLVNGWSGVRGTPPPRDAAGRFLPTTGQHTKEAKRLRWEEQDARKRRLAQEGSDDSDDQDSQSLSVDSDAAVQATHPALPSASIQPIDPALSSASIQPTHLAPSSPLAAGVRVVQAKYVDASTQTDDLPVPESVPEIEPEPVLCANCFSELEDKMGDLWLNEIEEMDFNSVEAGNPDCHDSIDHISTGSNPGLHTSGDQMQPAGVDTAGYRTVDQNSNGHLGSANQTTQPQAAHTGTVDEGPSDDDILAVLLAAYNGEGSSAN